MLSDIAKLYDPLDWLSPLIICFKILVQRTWVTGVAWDDNVPPDILESWLSARTDLSNISRCNIPRCVLIRNQTDATMEFHVFCDASEVAYGAVIYFRVKRTDGTTKVSPLTSKSRVAPIKTLTLPRRELCCCPRFPVIALNHQRSAKASDNNNRNDWTDRFHGRAVMVSQLSWNLELFCG